MSLRVSRNAGYEAQRCWTKATFTKLLYKDCFTTFAMTNDNITKDNSMESFEKLIPIIFLIIWTIVAVLGKKKKQKALLTSCKIPLRTYLQSLSSPLPKNCRKRSNRKKQKSRKQKKPESKKVKKWKLKYQIKILNRWK